MVRQIIEILILAMGIYALLQALAIPW